MPILPVIEDCWFCSPKSIEPMPLPFPVLLIAESDFALIDSTLLPNNSVRISTRSLVTA